MKNDSRDSRGLDKRWESSVAKPDSIARNHLVEQHLPLVRNIALRLRSHLPGSVEVEDLIAAGTLGLMGAIDSYDPSRGAPLECYCAARIRWAILDEWRSLDWVPRQVRRQIRAMTCARRAVQARLGRPASDDETAAELCLPQGQFHRMQQAFKRPWVISLDRREGPESDWQSPGSFVVDRTAADPPRQAMRREVRHTVLKGLGRQQRLIILMYYFEHMTMKEIGHVLSLSESRVSQMHSSILLKLRESLRHRQLDLSQAAGWPE